MKKSIGQSLLSIVAPALSLFAGPAVAAPIAAIERITASYITGWACDDFDRARIVDVMLAVDGVRRTGVKANLPNPGAAQKCGGIQKGFFLETELYAGKHLVEIVASDGTILAHQEINIPQKDYTSYFSWSGWTDTFPPVISTHGLPDPFHPAGDSDGFWVASFFTPDTAAITNKDNRIAIDLSTEQYAADELITALPYATFARATAPRPWKEGADMLTGGIAMSIPKMWRSGKAEAYIVGYVDFCDEANRCFWYGTQIADTRAVREFIGFDGCDICSKQPIVSGALSEGRFTVPSGRSYPKQHYADSEMKLFEWRITRDHFIETIAAVRADHPEFSPDPNAYRIDLFAFNPEIWVDKESGQIQGSSEFSVLIDHFYLWKR